MPERSVNLLLANKIICNVFTSAVAFSEYDVSLAASTSIGQGPFFTRVYKTAEGGMHVYM